MTVWDSYSLLQALKWKPNKLQSTNKIYSTYRMCLVIGLSDLWCIWYFPKDMFERILHI